MSLDDATNPVAADDTALATVTDDTGVDTDAQNEPEILYDDDGNPIEEPPEEEEIELDDGLKLKLPKDQAEKLRQAALRQADYTRKTQELSESRKAFEAERSTFHQVSQAELNAYAAATSLQRELAEFQNIDWQAWHDQDPAAASRASTEYMFKRDAHQQALAQLSHLRQQRVSHGAAEVAKRIEEGRGVLVRDVPGWSDTHKAKLLDFAAGFGFDKSELDDLEADPRVAKVLHAAFEGAEARRKSQAAQKHVQAQQVQPAAKAGSGRSAPPAGLDDRLSTEEWMRRREAQVQKKRA